MQSVHKSLKNVQLVIITGISGSGKSTALKAFEDLGYFCVDNMPVSLLMPFIQLKEENSHYPQRIALVMDAREEDFIVQHSTIFEDISNEGYHLEILFLDASDATIVQRFNQTRRKHPLAQNQPLTTGIKLERKIFKDLKERADRIIDTSRFNVHQLKEQIFTLYAPRKRLDQMVIHLVSFGFKYGVPAEANLVFDCRFLPNPFFVPELKPFPGTQDEVKQFVLEHPVSQSFVQSLSDMFHILIPAYRKEGKSYLVIAIGCTGGRHRSVAIVEHMKDVFTSSGEDVIVTHRDLHLEDQ